MLRRWQRVVGLDPQKDSRLHLHIYALRTGNHLLAEDSAKVMLVEAATDLDRAEALDRLGNALIARGSTREGAAAFRTALDLTRQAPGVRQGTLAFRIAKVGGSMADSGREAEALPLLEEAAAITRTTGRPSATGKTVYPRGIAWIFNELGSLYVKMGRSEEGRAALEAELGSALGRSEEMPDSMEYRSDLAVSYSRLGRLAQQQGDLAAAREQFTRSLEIQEAIVNADPTVIAGWRGIVLLRTYLGEIAAAQEDLRGAADHYGAAIETARQTLARSPGAHQLKWDLALAEFRRALLEPESGNWDELARQLEQLAQEQPTTPDQQRTIEAVRARLEAAASPLP
jgi:tetratricopeptide (TPR) repeat protein